jgi:hypothetical protein
MAGIVSAIELAYPMHSEGSMLDTPRPYDASDETTTMIKRRCYHLHAAICVRVEREQAATQYVATML